MVRYGRLVPECFADTALIEFLQYKNPNHKKGIGKVVNAIRGIDDFCIGMVDNDKIKPGELKNFIKIPIPNEVEIGLQLFNLNNSYLIITCPAFEAWILKLAAGANISINDFYPKLNIKTPLDLKKKLTERINLENEPQFKRFLSALREKNPQPFDTIQSWCQSVVDGKAIEAN